MTDQASDTKSAAPGPAPAPDAEKGPSRAGSSPSMKGQVHDEANRETLIRPRGLDRKPKALRTSSATFWMRKRLRAATGCPEAIGPHFPTSSSTLVQPSGLVLRSPAMSRVGMSARVRAQKERQPHPTPQRGTSETNAVGLRSRPGPRGRPAQTDVQSPGRSHRCSRRGQVLRCHCPAPRDPWRERHHLRARHAD